MTAQGAAAQGSWVVLLSAWDGHLSFRGSSEGTEVGRWSTCISIQRWVQGTKEHALEYLKTRSGCGMMSSVALWPRGARDMAGGRVHSWRTLGVMSRELRSGHGRKRHAVEGRRRRRRQGRAETAHSRPTKSQ